MGEGRGIEYCPPASSPPQKNTIFGFSVEGGGMLETGGGGVGVIFIVPSLSSAPLEKHSFFFYRFPDRSSLYAPVEQIALAAKCGHAVADAEWR